MVSGRLRPLLCDADIELRAAQLSIDRRNMTWDEREGWDRHANGGEVIGNREHQAMPRIGWIARRWAGWLAREISLSVWK